MKGRDIVSAADGAQVSTQSRNVRFMICEEKFTAQVFMRFMKQLIKGSKKKVFLILDNLPTTDLYTRKAHNPRTG
ncbi:MAG: hypothetical protein DRQ56_10095 [Gammaproteobacteria bacterium]|nr:MAG: hypothetical protein DRQ56_10095 [Gammaproteobacteria bacterium]